MNIKKADTIIKQVNAAVSKWNDFAAQINVKADFMDAVGKTLLLL